MVADLDAFCYYGGDLALDNSGGIQAATGWSLVSQNIQRLLMTNPAGVGSKGEYSGPDDLFHPTYGLGLKRQLGLPLSPAAQSQMQTKCLQAVTSNPAIASTPVPVVSVTQPALYELNIAISVALNDSTPGSTVLPQNLGYSITP